MNAERSSGPEPRRPSGPSGQPTRAATLSAVRSHNLSVVLHEIRSDPTATRARIASRVGLTRATVSDLVDQLLRAGLVAETETETLRRAGRPGMQLALAPRRFAALALEVQVDRVTVLALDLTGEPLLREVRVDDYRGPDGSATLDRVSAVALPMLDTLSGQGIRVAGVSLCIPGIVSDQRWVHLAPNLGWAGLDAAEALSARLGMPVTVHNDADTAARAEMRARSRAGMGPRAMNLFFVAGQVGIGGALIVDGSTVSGQHGWGGEVGHTTVDPDGPRCACSARGCLEVYAGRHALLARAGLGLDASIDDLAAYYRSGDARATSALDEAGSALGFAISNLLNVVDVGSVVLGGIYAPLFEYVAPRLRLAVQDHVLAARWRPVEVDRAMSGEDASVVGAALGTVDRLIADPTPWLVTG